MFGDAAAVRFFRLWNPGRKKGFATAFFKNFFNFSIVHAKSLSGADFARIISRGSLPCFEMCAGFLGIVFQCIKIALSLCGD